MPVVHVTGPQGSVSSEKVNLLRIPWTNANFCAILFSSTNDENYLKFRRVAKRQVIKIVAQLVVLQLEVSLVRQKLLLNPIIGN